MLTQQNIDPDHWIPKKQFAKSDPLPFENDPARSRVHNNISIIPFTEEHEQQVFELLMNEFRVSEPLCRSLGLSIAGSYQYFKDLVRICLESGVSFIAIDPSTQKVVGCRLNYVVVEKGKQVDEFADQYSPDVQSDIDFMNFLDSDVFDIISPKICRIMKFQGLCVMEAFQRRQIARKLVIASIEKADSIGCDAILVLASSCKSSGLFRSLGFEALKTVDQRQYKDVRTGEHVFAILPEEHRIGTLFIKYL